MHSARILALLALFVKHVHLFSWDIVVGTHTQLEFYNNDGTLTHTQVIPEASRISSVTYDPVQYRVLFADDHGLTTFITSFDVSTKTVQRLVMSTMGYYYVRVVYDPVTQALYWKEYTSIYTFSLNPASSNQADGNLVVTLEHRCWDLAVESCGGYIYWITNQEIGRARLDGSEKEVLIDNKVYERRSLAIDQQTQKIYWTEQTREGGPWFIESANFNGKNRTTLYIVGDVNYVFSLAVSKDFIYWQNYGEKGIWRLPKYSTQTVATKLTSTYRSIWGGCHRIASNYTIKEQIQGINSCDALQGLIPNDSKSESAASVCQNYCIQGECSVGAEGQPTCSCKAGYSGERCEVDACHEYCLHGGVCSLNVDNKRVCQCTAGYEGERCEVNACSNRCSNNGVCTLNEKGEPACECTAGYDGERCDASICKDYCLHGNCSVGAEGQPKCSCMPGHSGERCEENACIKHCLNGGVCTLNEEDEPSCQCTAGYDGGRCELSAYKDDSSDAGNSGKETVSACHQFCLNHGACSLNEAREPVCQCTADYEGERCEVPVNKDFSFQAACTVSAEGQPEVIVTLGQGVHSTCASPIL